MDLSSILFDVGIGAIVLFVVQYLVQIHKIRNGERSVGVGRVFFNWILIFCIIGGFGGHFYINHHSASQAAATKQTVSKQSHEDYLFIRYDKDKAKMNSQGEAPMKIVVSPNTRVKIYGHNTHTLFKTFKAKKGTGPITLHYTFTQDSRYDIVAIRGGKRLVKTIKIRSYKGSSSSSTTSTSSSSSSSSHNSSSQSSSSRNHNSSSNNNGGGSSSTGSSYSGGSGYSGGGYSGGGGGGTSSYHPSYRPSAPSTPSTPAAPSNGTGALH